MKRRGKITWRARFAMRFQRYHSPSLAMMGQCRCKRCRVRRGKKQSTFSDSDFQAGRYRD